MGPGVEWAGMPRGEIGWIDLTVPEAAKVRDFYSQVVGWEHAEVDMGGYSDFSMNLPGAGKTVAGICHSRGVNADLPAQWLIYINVDNLEASLKACERAGGKVLREATALGSGRMAVIQDPAGAVAALYQPETSVEGLSF